MATFDPEEEAIEAGANDVEKDEGVVFVLRRSRKFRFNQKSI
jgi:hypothetical protein